MRTREVTHSLVRAAPRPRRERPEPPLHGELRTLSIASIAELTEPANRDRVVRAAMASRGVSLDTAWSGLGIVLPAVCDEDPLGGWPLIEVDDGLGPPGLIMPDEVQLCALALAAVDERAVRDAFDPDELARHDIYPGGWHEPGRRDWLLDAFGCLRDFYDAAAERDHGVLCFLRRAIRA